MGMAGGREQPGELWDTLRGALMEALGPEQSPAPLSAGIQRAPLVVGCLVPSLELRQLPAWSQPLLRCSPCKGSTAGGLSSPGKPPAVLCTPLLGTHLCLHSPRGTALVLFTEIKGLRGCSSPFQRSSHTLERSGAP